MKHSEPIGPVSRTAQVVAEGIDADDAQVGVRILESAQIGLQPSSSPQSIEVSSLRLSCLGAGGGVPGHPQVSGYSRHSKVTHCPA